MFERLYVEALLLDEVLHDVVWDPWHNGEVDDFTAAWCSYLLYLCGQSHSLDEDWIRAFGPHPFGAHFVRRDSLRESLNLRPLPPENGI